MTPQERELLGAFLQQLTLAQAGQKDAEADALIRAACARQADAAYLLVQRAMGLEYALQNAQAQTAKLQLELDQSRAATQPSARGGFLDASNNAWGRSAPAAGTSPPPLAPAFSGRPAAQAAAAPASSWGSGMLGTVATTAAGVVAGSFLFQGIQGLMGHHSANTAPAPDAARQAAAAPEVPSDAPEERSDYADAGGSDFDAGDSG